LFRSGDALVVSEIGTSGEDGAAATFGPAGSVAISFQDFSAGVDFAGGASVRFAVSGTVDGVQEEVANVVATLAQGQVVMAPDPGAPSVEEVLILRGGEVVASSRQTGAATAVDGDWPTRITMEDNINGVTGQALALAKDLITSNNVAGVAWSEPVALTLEGSGEVLGDQLFFVFGEPRAVESLTRGELTATAIDALVIKGIDLPPFVDTPPF
jgi:hypothetical protein